MSLIVAGWVRDLCERFSPARSTRNLAHGAAWQGSDAVFPKFHGGEVHAKQRAEQWAAESGDEFDGLNGPQTGDTSGDRAEHREASFPIGRGLWVEAGEAAGCARQEGGDGGFEGKHRALYEGLLKLHRGAIDGETLFKQGRGIDKHIGTGGDAKGVVVGDVFIVRHDFEPRVQISKAAHDALDAGFAEMIVGLKKLPVEIRGEKVATSGEDESADARGCKLQGNKAAQPTHARDEDSCVLEAFLGLHAESWQIELPPVGFELFRSEFREFHGGEFREPDGFRGAAVDRQAARPRNADELHAAR